LIARSHLPAHFACWNGATGAPYHGPFALYPYNCATRIWEYPWAFHAIPSQPGMRALDIGGGLSGFAVTLARNKLEVTVLDPGKSGQEPGVLLEQLARMHGAEVRHVEGHPGDPGLALDGFDLVYCLSVVEHLPSAQERARLMRAAWDALRPGGHFVLTVDLDLSLRPFTSKDRAPGSFNVPIPELLAAAPFRLVQGLLAELYGLPGFSAPRVRARAEAGELFLANGRILAQCLVLERPVDSG